MPEHNALIGEQLHPPQPLTFIGAVESYIPPAAGLLVVKTDTTPYTLYLSTGVTAGAVAAIGSSGAPGGGGVSLTSGLVFWYKFNNNLTDTSTNNLTLAQEGAGTLMYVASTLDNAVDFSPFEYAFSINNALVHSFHTGFHIAMVGRLVTVSGSVQVLISQGNNFNGEGKFIVEALNSSQISMGSWRGFSNLAQAVVASPAVGVDFLLEVYYDPTPAGAGSENGTIGIAIDNGAFVTAGLATGDVMDTTAIPLWLGGALDGGGSGPNFSSVFGGTVDLFAAWSAPFTDLSPTGPERAALWNGGAFRSDP